MHPTRLGQRYISKHARANQIAARLLRHCSGPARFCSQPACIGRINLLPAVAPTDLRSVFICTHFWKNVIIFVTTTPYRHKKNPAHVLHMVGTRLRAKFRRRRTRRLGGDMPQTK